MKTTIERKTNEVTVRMSNGIIISIEISGNWNNYELFLTVLDCGTIITEKTIAYGLLTKKDAQKEMTQYYREAIKEYK